MAGEEVLAAACQISSLLTLPVLRMSRKFTMAPLPHGSPDFLQFAP